MQYWRFVITDVGPAVGFLGLGAMGLGMVSRLVDTGFSVSVWNRTAEAVEHVAAYRGVTAAASPAEVFASRSIVHSMLANDDAVLDVVDDDLLSTVPAGCVHVNHSTISPATARELAARHARHDVGYVQAPVLGRSTVAATGELLVLAAGRAAAIAAAEDSLAALGKRTWDLGDDVASASIVKIAVNYSLIAALQSIAESVSLVEAAGINSVEFVDILTHTAFSGTAHRGYAPLIAEMRYEPVGFAMELGLKDLGLAESVAAEGNVTLAMAPVLREVFEAAMADPILRTLDWSAIAEITRRRGRP